MNVVRINYDGYKETLKYLSVECNKTLYESGDFIKDWYTLMKDYIVNEMYDGLICSSSVDHFFFDGADYDSCRLQVDDDGKAELIYIDLTSVAMGSEDWFKLVDIEDNAIEFFTPKDSKMTWNELKEYCK